MLHFLVSFAKAAEPARTLAIGNITINIWWWPYFFAAVKFFLIFLTLLLLAGIVLVVIRAQSGFKIRLKEAIEEAMEMGKLPKTKIQKEWEAIMVNLESNDPKSYKKAVVMAENLFERVLKAASLAGENLEERLKKIPGAQLEFKEDIIWSYNLRSKIVSDERFEVDHEEAKRAVYVFERTLKALEII